MSGPGTVGTAFPVTFAVRNGDGSPRTGLAAGAFTATVRNPGDSASDTPAVSEVGGGMYRFTISSAFTTTHGEGAYGWTVELTSAPLDLIAGTVQFYDEPALAIADVQTALTNQGYTAARAPNLDNLDAAVSTRATQADILSDATPFAGANIDTTVSSRSSHSAADVDTTLSGSHGAGSWEGATAPDVADAVWDEARAGHNSAGSFGETLNSVESKLPANDFADETLQQASHAQTQADIAALNDLSQADVQSALTAQGYTTARAALLDNLDAAISSVISAIGALEDVSVSDILAGVVDSSGSPTVTIELALRRIHAYCVSTINKSGNDYAYRNAGNSATLFTLTDNDPTSRESDID